MKTLVLTQKKYSISLKDNKNIENFITELHLLSKTLNDERTRGFQLVQAAVDGLNQTIEVTVTASQGGQAQMNGTAQPANAGLQSGPSDNTATAQDQQAGRSLPPRPSAPTR